jgi:hypothetical protein
MLKIKNGIIILLSLILFSACSVTEVNKSSRSADFTPDIVEMHVTPDDYQYLGEMEVSVEHKRYFGIFKVMGNINGEPAKRRMQKSITLYGSQWMNVSDHLRRALFKVHQQYPEGDLVVPAYKISKKKKMFLGRRIKETLKVKIYKRKI